jgi:hypothetical protein
MRLRPLLLPLLVLPLLPSPAGARQIAEPVTVSEANEAILKAIGSLRHFYAPPRQRERPPECDELAGENCFAGEYECLTRCAPWDGQPIRGLAEVYERTAALVARAVPGVDGEMLEFLHGQRVGVWARLGETGRARRAAEECTGTAWWCLALRGWVEHLEGDYVASERTFRAALDSMDSRRACYWTEVVLYRDTLGSSAGHRGGTGHCRPLDDYAAFWTLADPLWSQPGNSRLTEHFARHADMRVHEQYLHYNHNSTHPLRHHTTLLRYGQPTGWHPWMAGTALTYGRGGQGFLVLLPTAEALRAPQPVFRPVEEGATETFRRPGGPVAALPVQTGFFRRDGAEVLLVRSRATGDASALDWHLIGWDGERFRDGVVVPSADSLLAWFDAPWEPQIVSLEAARAGGAWRARTGTDAPAADLAEGSEGVALSSLVLIDAGGPQPHGIPAILRAMRPGMEVEAGERVAAFWELYAHDAVNATVELTTTSLTPPGFVARLLGRTAPVRRVRWTELIEPAAGVHRHALALDLEALEPGPYEVALTLRLHDGSRLRTAARVEIVP